MKDSPETSKDLHYLITRIINPILNSIIATLSDNYVLYYRDGSLNFKEYTTPNLMARFLEDWRKELWYKYSGKNLAEVSEEILSDYIRAIEYVYSRLYKFPIAENIKADLILLGQKIEEYLTGKIEMFSNFTFEIEKSKPKTSRKEEKEEPDKILKIQINENHSSLYRKSYSTVNLDKKVHEKTEGIEVPITAGTWHPKDYVHYDNVIVVVGNLGIKEKGSIFVTPSEVYVKTPSFNGTISRTSSIRFEYRNGKRWIIVPYYENTSQSSPAFTKKKRNTFEAPKKRKKFKGKYVVIGVVILLLILAGYLYSQRSFDNITAIIFGKSHNNSSRENNVYMPSYTNTHISSQTATPTIRTTPAFIIPPESYCSNGYWRYIFEDALKCALTEEELSKISYLANQLKGKTLQESVWNILDWLDENIEYDYYKASLPEPIIWRSLDGEIIGVSGGEGTEVQTPYETIQKGKGVCGDYTVLTAALLLEMGYDPVYVLEIDFKNSQIGHVTTIVKINDDYFVLDQHLPVMDLGTYYNSWSVYRQETLNETLFISNATVYEIKKSGNGVLVRKIEVLSAEDFKRKDHTFSSLDLSKISEDLRRMFKEHYPNLIFDSNIADLDKGYYLPIGYSDGRIWRMEFPHYADYYNPVFHEQFIEHFYEKFVENSEIRHDLQRFNRFWIKIKQENDSIKVILNLAKK
ncbi:transglutaminase-like domain-containing protein [Thermococcus sp. 2319x1]|uniref:transglutaminase-like domain-containing protein n=1 Tax=Thermococcus sp. 2319x1 TaxID=1674923 RepID=UPI00158197DF|nr:transglutaminase-like domain-containing protein [Thermococcus sp. 2319x1]